MRKVEVVPHHPHWRIAFEEESQRIQLALGKNAVAVYHIGSTAIPKIYAKPIIDILVAGQSLKKVDESNSQMEALGYQVMGEYGIPGRRYFRKDDEAGIRTHHVHVFEVNSEQVERHLTFRDYLIAHPEEAQIYSELKRKLAKRYPEDIEGYMDGKDEFIKQVDCKAAAWRKALDRSRI